jgi:transcriptional regulator PpsR
VIEAFNSSPPTRFSAPEDSLAAMDAASASALIATSADVSLIVDGDGTILDAAFSDPALGKAIYRDWIGQKWVNTVTAECRSKIEDLLRDAAPLAPTRWRQVNHSAPVGPDVPVRYCAIRFGSERRILAVGRDLRAMADLQLRLAEAQQAMEREYARIRNAEKRYRLLFQLSSEPVLIVDSASQRVLEANPAASTLLGLDPKKVGGQAFAELFELRSRQAAQSFVAAARVAPRVDNVHVELARDRAPVLLSGSMFRQEGSAQILVLLARFGETVSGVSKEDARLLSIVGAMPEAFVVTDADRRILSANAAFVDLVQATTEAQVRGEPIERWIGRPGVDMDVLYSNLRTHGVVRHFSTVARGEFGSNEDVEVSAVASTGSEPCLGFTIRSVALRAGRERLGGRELPRTVEQFTDLVGRVPLKNLVRETTDLIERLCIEAALELTRDNRASAAEMLGLSRQGFYAKLRRYGLGELDDVGSPS